MHCASYRLCDRSQFITQDFQGFLVCPRPDLVDCAININPLPLAVFRNIYVGIPLICHRVTPFEFCVLSDTGAHTDRANADRFRKVRLRPVSASWRSSEKPVSSNSSRRAAVPIDSPDSNDPVIDCQKGNGLARFSRSTRASGVCTMTMTEWGLLIFISNSLRRAPAKRSRRHTTQLWEHERECPFLSAESLKLRRGHSSMDSLPSAFSERQ